MRLPDKFVVSRALYGGYVLVDPAGEALAAFSEPGELTHWLDQHLAQTIIASETTLSTETLAMLAAEEAMVQSFAAPMTPFEQELQAKQDQQLKNTALAAAAAFS